MQGDDLEGLFQIAEVFPIQRGTSSRHTTEPLEDLLPCNAQPMYRRDQIVDAQAIANQHIILANLNPRVESGWKLRVYQRCWDGAMGEFLDEYRVTDPDIVNGGSGPHQEIQANKIKRGNVVG